MSRSIESPSPAGTLTAFFYGTLMVPQIFFRVTHATEQPPPPLSSLYTFSPALLRNFSRRKVHFADYPAIIACRGHSVLGCFVTGLTDSDVYYLNMFEGSQYRRQECEVQILPMCVLKEDGNTDEGVMKGCEKEHTEGKAVAVKTWVYAWSDPEGGLEEEEWDYKEFRKEKLKNWVGGRNVEEYAEAARVQKSINGVEVVDLTGGEGEEGYVWSGRTMTREEVGRLHEDFSAEHVDKVNDVAFGDQTSAWRDKDIKGESVDKIKAVVDEKGAAGHDKHDEPEESETEDMRTNRIASVIAGIARMEEAEAELGGKETKSKSKDCKVEMEEGEIETLVSAV